MIKESIENKIVRLYVSGSTRKQISQLINVPLEIVQRHIELSGAKPDNTLKQKEVVIKNTTQGKIKIRINHNTEVYMKPDQNEDEVREKWLSIIHRERLI